MDPKELSELLANLPERLFLDTLMGEVDFKVEMIERLERAERGEAASVSHEEVKERYAEWPPSSGQ